MRPVDIAGISVVGWLIGEHDYQFNKFDEMYGDELLQRRDFIQNSEIPNKWHRNIVLRKGESHALANQQVLKVCAAARAVVVYDACIDGARRRDASNETFHGLFDHLSKADETSLPVSSILLENFDTAFPDRKPKNMFLRAGEIATRALLDEHDRTGNFHIPGPGLSSGNIGNLKD